MHIHTDIYACTFTRILLLQQKLCYKILSALLTYYLNQARHYSISCYLPLWTNVTSVCSQEWVSQKQFALNI